MKKSTTLQVSAIFFACAAGLHLVRVLAGWEVTIDGWAVPAWLSVLLVVCAGTLAVQLWKMRK